MSQEDAKQQHVERTEAAGTVSRVCGQNEDDVTDDVTVYDIISVVAQSVSDHQNNNNNNSCHHTWLHMAAHTHAETWQQKHRRLRSIYSIIDQCDRIYY